MHRSSGEQQVSFVAEAAERAMRPLKPPSLHGPVVLGITCVFVLLTLFRGTAWISAEGGTLPDSVVRAPVSPEQWGGALVIAANLFLVAVLSWRHFLVAVLSWRHFLVWCGHALLVCVYVGITLSTASQVLQTGSLSPGAGWQACIAPVGAVIWHATLSWLMGVLPERGHWARSKKRRDRRRDG